MTENIVNDVENFGKLETNEGIITTSEQQKNITEFGRRLGRIETEIKARKLDIKEFDITKLKIYLRVTRSFLSSPCFCWRHLSFLCSLPLPFWPLAVVTAANLLWHHKPWWLVSAVWLFFSSISLVSHRPTVL